jgi:alkyl sulfatase BDS1-like metallo-beta-lactamase superfamily hydrolase
MKTLACLALLAAAQAQNPAFGVQDPTLDGRELTAAVKVTDAIHLAVGFGNTYLVKTAAGNVIIDTSSRLAAQRHKKFLQAVDGGPVKYIILTHGHADHRGGVAVWKEAGTQVIAQENYAEFLHYQMRLAGFLASRAAAQFGPALVAAAAPPNPNPGNYAANIDATVLFAEKHEFELGGVKFEVHHTPGETPDHTSVWIPQWKAAFVGDNFYASFPNLYTLRGTQPRWALEYVASLNKVLSWRPEILLPSHGRPITGAGEISRQLTRYRDAILYVHDSTVRGMNEGKDVFRLMREIRLPKELDVGEGYGNLPWSVRGIYEGYAGWFDGNPSTMYETPVQDAHPELVRLSGGPDKVAARARELLAAGQIHLALHLADAALRADPGHRAALEVRIAALETLLKLARNSNERGWLNHGIRQAKERLAR